MYLNARGSQWRNVNCDALGALPASQPVIMQALERGSTDQVCMGAISVPRNLGITGQQRTQ
jgi:hypothetical protein